MPEPVLSNGSEAALDLPKDAKAPWLANPGLWREKALVGDDWIATGETIAVENPATGRLLGEVPNLGRAETERAIAAAERALAGWRQTSAGERAAILRRWNELVRQFPGLEGVGSIKASNRRLNQREYGFRCGRPGRLGWPEEARQGQGNRQDRHFGFRTHLCTPVQSFEQ
jgi:hypothetical protein